MRKNIKTNSSSPDHHQDGSSEVDSVLLEEYGAREKRGMFPPRYIVDLDLPPEERWKEVARDFAADGKRVEKLLQEELSRQGVGMQMLETMVTGIFSGLSKVGAVLYADELRAFAKLSGMSLGKLTLLQLVYEAAAHCTSIIVPSEEGPPRHIRTMDWGMDFLSPLTIEVVFTRGQRILCIASTWAGYSGVLTGMKFGACSVSVNFRVTERGTFAGNLKRLVTYAWPIGFLVREVLCSEGTTFESARGALMASELVAPCYFTIAGCRADEGCVITRDPKEVLHEQSLASGSPCVQANMDHWNPDTEIDVMHSARRFRKANEVLQQRGDFRQEQLWSMMSTPPIFNDITIYCTLMVPSSNKFETRLPHQHFGFNETGLDAAVGDPGRVLCISCGRTFNPSLNAPGECKHTGEWHNSFSSCGPMCAVGLGITNLGKCHWSCCFAVSLDSPCSKSGAHVVA